jgi:pimeloyl-ACP methyl ester carboxylesterase
VTAIAAAAERSALRSIERDPEFANLVSVPRGRTVRARSADGTTLHAEVFGSEHGPTFVLVPGWTEQIGYWGPVSRLLTHRGYRVVAYDLRGQGMSDPAAEGDYALARYGEDLEAVLAATCDGRRDVLVVGHSLGAMSIAAWAEHHDVRGRVCGAALLNTGVEGLVDMHRLYPVQFLPPILQRPFAVAIFLGNTLRVPPFSTRVSRGVIRYVAFAGGSSDSIVRYYERMLTSCDPRVRAAAGVAMSEMCLIHALPRLTVPTAVIAGADDRLTPPSHAHLIARVLPALDSLVVMPRTGHMGPLERPVENVLALIELASRTLPSPLELAA